jgi:hypothetical protein
MPVGQERFANNAGRQELTYANASTLIGFMMVSVKSLCPEKRK